MEGDVLGRILGPKYGMRQVDVRTISAVRSDQDVKQGMQPTKLCDNSMLIFPPPPSRTHLTSMSGLDFVENLENYALARRPSSSSLPASNPEALASQAVIIWFFLLSSECLPTIHD